MDMAGSGLPGSSVNTYMTKQFCRLCGRENKNKGGVGICQPCLIKEHFSKKHMEEEVLDVGEVPEEEVAENEEETIE